MLQITEIHPNPKGTDGNNEWIEIKNLSPNQINLQNYVIDDEEGGSKPYTIETPTILQPNQLYILEKSTTALNLNNQGDEIRIFAPVTTKTPNSSQPTTSLRYPPSEEGLSYSLITILSQTGKKQTYTWTEPTKNQPNQTYYALEGTIAQPPEIDKEFTFTILEKTTQNPLTIIFEEETLNFETAVLLLKPGTNVNLLTKKTTQQNTFQLLDFKIAETQETTEKTETQNATNETQNLRNPLPIPTIMIPLTLLILLTITLALLKKIKLKNHQKQL